MQPSFPKLENYKGIHCEINITIADFSNFSMHTASLCTLGGALCASWVLPFQN